MIAETIAVGVISAGAAIGSQFVGAWSKLRSDRYVKRIEYLQAAQNKLLEPVGELFVPIPSFEENEIIEWCRRPLDSTSLNKRFVQEYKQLMNIFLQYRHHIRKPLRSKCDLYFSSLQTTVFEAGDLGNVEALPEPKKQELLTHLHTLWGLVFLGIVQALEAISDQATK